MTDIPKDGLTAPTADELAQRVTEEFTWRHMETMLRNLTPCHERGLRHVATDLTASVLVCKTCGMKAGRI